MLRRRRPVCLVNARVWADGGEARSLRFDAHVLDLDDAPRKGDEVVDLDGAFVLPGLLNAHDHLELNHYGPLLGDGHYANASQWIDGLRPRLRDDAAIRANQAFPLAQRLFIGALKNLLAGVTRVAHHNPAYRDLRTLPIRTLDRYAWAHSYGLEGRPVGAQGEVGPPVAQTCRLAPSGVPFFVHVAEGCDEAAAAELTRLEADGCLVPTTVLVHGVAMTATVWRRVIDAGASLVWCPVSNHAMFGTSAPVRAMLDAMPDAWRHIALGTDSRLTGSRDLLAEMHRASDLASVSADELLRMVTTAAADVLRVPHGGRLAVGAPADLIVVPPRGGTAASALLACDRGTLRTVVVGGVPQLGHPDDDTMFRARRVRTAGLCLDGHPKIADYRLVRAIERCPIAEPGLSVAF